MAAILVASATPLANKARPVHTEKNAATNDDGLLAWAPQQETMAAGENPQFPISGRDTDAVIAGVKAAFLAKTGATIPFRIEKVRVMADLLAALQASMGRQDVGESGRGAFYNNTIYVIQNTHRTTQQLATTKLYGRAAQGFLHLDFDIALGIAYGVVATIALYRFSSRNSAASSAVGCSTRSSGLNTSSSSPPSGLVRNASA